MYRMSVSERLSNDINKIFKFVHVELNKTRELLML